MKNLFNIGFVVLILVVLGCNCQRLQEMANQGKSTPTTSSPTSSSPSTSPGSSDTGSNLTMEKYNKIQNGMSYQEVKDIIGREGTQTMSSGEGKYKVESYKWEAEDYKFISVVFMGGKVNSKVQANLK